MVSWCTQVSALLSLHEGAVWREDEGTRGAELHFLGPDRGVRLSPALVREACKRRGLSSFMVPRVVLAQHAALPTNASGKLLKHAVREILLTRLRHPHGGTASRM